MDKKKIDFAKYNEMCEEKKVVGKDRTEITVRTHIPYRDKFKMARELVEQNVIIHNDSCAYDNYLDQAVWMLKILEYYTDVDTDGVDEEHAADFMINNEVSQNIHDIIENDLCKVEEIYFRMRDGVMTTFEDDKSLKTALKTSFGFLFNGEDVTESLAKAETVSGTLFDALAALRKEDERRNPGKIDVGGNILNFAKKE